jgi:hypothetical protein
VEPKYYSRYPPIGLLKLSSYHKKKLNDSTELVKGITTEVSKKPDIIYVTSLFTWAWQPVWGAVHFYSKEFPDAELWLGGLYASLMPEHAALSGVDSTHIFKGIFTKAECLRPDYSLVPEWNKSANASIIFTSRGCIRSCTFCGVSRIEGRLNSEKKSIRKIIWPEHKRVILFDNNFLASCGWESVLRELQELNLTVDFNQGLDARLITERVASKICEAKIDRFVRLSYDTLDIGLSVKNAIELLKSHGINGRNILVYVLYNFTDSPQDLFIRIKNILSWGAVAYPMRFQPVTTLAKNTYIAPSWDKIRLNAVQRARRVIGKGGAFPPYEGMLKVKVEGCNTFDEAFDEFMKPVGVVQ